MFKYEILVSHRPAAAQQNLNVRQCLLFFCVCAIRSLSEACWQISCFSKVSSALTDKIAKCNCKWRKTVFLFFNSGLNCESNLIYCVRWWIGHINFDVAKATASNKAVGSAGRQSVASSRLKGSAQWNRYYSHVTLQSTGAARTHLSKKEPKVLQFSITSLRIHANDDICAEATGYILKMTCPPYQVSDCVFSLHKSAPC